MWVVVPVLSSGAGFARMVGHHLWWTILWIALWHAVHRFGLVTVAVGVVAVLVVGMLVWRRPGTGAPRRLRWGGRKGTRAS